MPPKKPATRKRTRAARKEKPRTLASVSQQGVQEMLSDSKEGAAEENTRLDKISHVLKAPAGRDVTVAECGAPAYEQNDENNVVGGSDIEWEELEGPPVQEGDVMQIELENDRDGDANKKLTKQEKAIQKNIAQLMLVCRVAHGMRCDRATDDSLLQGLMLSLLPKDQAMEESEDPSETIQELIEWFNKNFTQLSSDHESLPAESKPRALSVRKRLKNAFELQKGTSEELTYLFLALLKALGFQSRSVRLFEVSKSPTLGKELALEESQRTKVTCWCEVWMENGKNARWTHVDPLQELVDCPHEVNSLLTASANPYILAYNGGGAKDVSVRYITNVKRCEQLRKDKWWNAAIEPLSYAMLRALQSTSSPQSKKRGQQQTAGEDKELAESLESRRKQDPKTLDDFKHSLKYVLPRHIKRYEALKPKAEPVGVYRDENYFKRSDLAELHSSSRWRNFGRVVKESELSKPYKQVKRWFGARKKQVVLEELSDEEDGGGDDDDLLGLYGHWQTKKWRVPVAQNGIVPKNEFGKVDVPPLVPSLPKNTTHLTLPRLIPICRDLEIDFALATVGFEPVSCGRLVPRNEGIIVCSEFAQQVIDAYEERERHEALAQHQAEMESGKDGWKRLLSAVQAHLKVQQRYGAASDEIQTPKRQRKQRKKP